MSPFFLAIKPSRLVPMYTNVFISWFLPGEPMYENDIAGSIRTVAADYLVNRGVRRLRRWRGGLHIAAAATRQTDNQQEDKEVRSSVHGGPRHNSRSGP